MSYLFKKFDIQVFEEVVGILREQEVVWWADQGTLLGMIRDNVFLPWDHDVDIGAWKIESEKLNFLLRSFRDKFSYCYYDDLNSTLKIVFFDSSENDYWWFDISFYDRHTGQAVKYWRKARGLKFVYALLFGFYEVLLGGPIGRTKNLFKRFVKYPAEVMAFIISKAGGGRCFSRRLCTVIKNYFSIILTVSVDIEYFESIDTIYFNGVEVNVPRSPEKYLEYKYGDNWRVPRKEWNYLLEDRAISSNLAIGQTKTKY